MAIFGFTGLIAAGIYAAFAAGATGLALFVNWWMGLTDWWNIGLFMGVLIALLVFWQSTSVFARIAVILIVGFALYIKGQLDGRATAYASIEASKQAELTRQRTANEEAQKEAAERISQLEVKLKETENVLEIAKCEASLAKTANQIALNAASVDRINRLRPGPARGAKATGATKAKAAPCRTGPALP